MVSNVKVVNSLLFDLISIIMIIHTRSEARFARLYSLIMNCLIVVVGGRVHEWCKKGSVIL